MSSDRETLKAEFLRSAGLGAARREPLSGDASTRRYERLYPASGGSLIFMDQPPVESDPCPPDATPEQRRAGGYNALARLAAGRVDAFVAAAGWLRAQGLSAPRIEAHDAGHGLAVLEDLGDDLYARLIEAGAEEWPLYDGAIEALVRLHAITPPAMLSADGADWPLLDYDAVALRTAGDLFVEWLPKLKTDLTFGADATAEWDALWTPIYARGAAGASVFCHRDYHAENLIWLPERESAARVGLLDFQDALRAHPAWDLSMLLHDARRDVSADLEAAALDRYFALRPDADRAALTADYHSLGALNISRILGIFARLVTRDAKPRYAAFMPRLWEYLDRCLADPELAPLKAWFDRHVPRDARR
ncbi:N-acetylmuramate/N-acetylglucosamine kinase AmgK [Phenylobacterium sp.]|uniref:N-acetylmuramate/N-acetylglucosamine kinase AmgK n=1 Tax=Phenylobacterium sp. TaxID=1871053 RepID=UPI0027348402|nr:phosphotransferase [Phenylobacterium sp.]MDP3660230.1 phosphotransferase [Phenylobacterium sp.]